MQPGAPPAFSRTRADPARAAGRRAAGGVPHGARHAELWRRLRRDAHHSDRFRDGSWRPGDRACSVGRRGRAGHESAGCTRDPDRRSAARIEVHPAMDPLAARSGVKHRRNGTAPWRASVRSAPIPSPTTPRSSVPSAARWCRLCPQDWSETHAMRRPDASRGSACSSWSSNASTTTT